jgi:hypothetical protein
MPPQIEPTFVAAVSILRQCKQGSLPMPESVKETPEWKKPFSARHFLEISTMVYQEGI